MVLGRSVPTLSSVSLTFRSCRFETLDQIELQAIEVRRLLPIGSGRQPCLKGFFPSEKSSYGGVIVIQAVAVHVPWGQPCTFIAAVSGTRPSPLPLFCSSQTLGAKVFVNSFLGGV